MSIIWKWFRRPTGDVDHLEMAPLGEGHHLVQGLGVHQLRAVGAGFKMAVAARLVAE
jgi:hypothetical protein